MKIFTIIKKEYLQIVKKKSFVISTVLTPLMMGIFIFLPILLTRVGREQKKILIGDYSGIVLQPFLEKSNADPETQNSLKLLFMGNSASTTEITEQNKLIKIYEGKISGEQERELPLIPVYKKKLLNKEIDGLVFIPENVKKNRRIYFCAVNISDFEMNRYISFLVQKIIAETILKEHHVDLSIVSEATREVNMSTFKVKKEGTAKVSSGMEYMAAIFMLTILFSIIMAYGQLMMRGVIEEKNSRIVEILISSTRAETLFYGKILGIGLAGLTQVSIWGLLAFCLLAGTSPGIHQFLTLEVGIYFIIFFVLGYFMFAILFSIVGASVNTDQEAQQFAAPLTYLLVIPFFIGIMATQNPNSPLVVLASLFPLFAPTLMFMRIGIALPPFSQIILTIVLSVFFIMFLAWLGAKIFRVGILMYGKKPGLKEIIRWAKYK
ncbi:MAG: ABC transporter permease [Acidobacteria bacterium]|jgi:ABC-2 type transport system permease protein|nr:ABC transporter permease [Acidobacteriota bacterium]